MKRKNKKIQRESPTTPTARQTENAPSLVSPTAAKTRRKLSIGKKLFFSAVMTLLFFVTLEGSLAIFGLKPVATTEDPFVGFAGQVPLFVKSTGASGSTEYVTARNKLRWFNRQRFPADKPANGYRVFCLGGSTTYGHPYDDKTSFGGWLRELLPEADPSKQWEIINCGGISYASYRVANLMKELLEYEPDLFIIYTGHNEFLEARTYGQLLETPSLVLRAGGLASRTRTFAAVSRLMKAVGVTNSAQAKPNTSGELLPSEVNTLLDSAVGLEVYHRDDQHRQHVFEHFRLNLRRMVEMARQRGAKVILVSPAANIGQCSPFKSEHKSDLIGPALLEWNRLYAQADQLYSQQDYAAALAPINRAVELDGRHAATLYLRGRILLALGEAKRARRDFEKARDEDVCTLRAPAEVIEAVRETAADLQVPLVDFVDWVEKNSADGVAGDALFLDHVHGTIEAYRELAALLASKILELGDLENARPLTAEMIAAATDRVMSRIDAAEHGAALRNISKVYSWAGKKEDADRIALRAMELIPDDAETVYQAANANVRLGNVDEGIRLYERVAELNPSYAASVHASLGFAYGVKGDEQKCMEHYQQALKLNPNYPDIHYNLGTILERRQKYVEAEAHYKQAIAGNAHHYQAQYRLGLVYSLQQNWVAAREQFLEAARLNPTALEPHIGLGQVLAILGDKAAARVQFQWVLEREPNNSDAQLEMRRLDKP